MILLLFLQYYQTKIINSQFAISIFPSFGLQSNGEFNINISSCHSKKIFIGLSCEDQIGNIWDSKFDYHVVCKPDNHYNFTFFNDTITIDSEDQIISQKYIISASEIVTPIIIVCDKNETFLEASISFHNNKSYLDSRYRIMLYAAPLHCLFYLALLISFIIALLSKAGFFIYYHIFLMLTLLVLSANMIVQIACLVSGIVRPEDTYVKYIFFGLNIFTSGLVFASVTLASGGWQIHTVRFDLGSFLFSLFSGFAYGTEYLIYNLVNIFGAEILVYLVKIISLIVFAKATVYELRCCEQFLLSYALIIDTVGIDSKTTPVHRRILMQNICLALIVFYLIAEIMIIHAQLFIPIMPIWVGYIVYNGIQNIAMFTLMVNYIPWSIDKTSWMATFDDEDKLIDCAMEDFNLEAYQQNNHLKHWENGQKLPLPPLIATNDFKIQDFNEKELALIDEQNFK